MKKTLLILSLLLCLVPMSRAQAIRVLFLGHESEHHNSNLYFPMLAQALGPDAIYFDYTTSVEEALGDAKYLGRFDAVMLYANHDNIAPHQWKNLKAYVRGGGAFLPIHCASYCFRNEPEFDQMVGGQFKSHQTGEFTARTVVTDHEITKGLPEFNAWDETYFHSKHNPKNRTVLQVRDARPGDPHTDPEPWTWVRTEGKGRVFYTASGHDQRVWNRPEFHQLLKNGILWSVGEKRVKQYEAFLAGRAPLKYEKRGDIANYENRPEPLLYQLPLSAKESMQYTRVPMGFRLELFASEPDIVNPIFIAWDERGRLWAAETVDYPNEIKEGRKGNDRIKILEDTNGDGRCDKVTVFADGLNIPTSLTFVDGGVIVAHAPDFIFFKDTDGDDKADVRRVLNTGWGIGDTHAGPSNLRYGFDNRIWGTVGYSGYSGKRADGRDNRFGSGVFRMNRDGSEVEFLHQFNNNTWGVGFNERGDVFGSTANNNPSFFCGFPATAYADGDRGMSAKMVANSRAFHPITPNVRQVDAFGNYTAGAGHALATSASFPEAWRNRMAFVGGPTGHLLGGYLTSEDGSGFKSKNAFAIVASADEWFSPVAAEVGPDGNLWVVDWYNFIIQHNPTPSRGRGGYDAKRGVGNAHVNPNRDRQHGRIYRLVWEDAPKPKIKSLAKASTRELVKALGDENLFWRLTAQRLLIERGVGDQLQPLRKLIVAGETESIHALRALQGVGQLDRQIHQAALLSGNSALKQNAIDALGESEADVQLFFDTAVITDRNPQVRRVAFVKMAEFPKSESVGRAVQSLLGMKENMDDAWLSLALTATAKKQGAKLGSYKLGPNILANGSFEEVENGKPVGWDLRTYRRGNGTEHELVKGKATARTGEYAVRISSEGPTDTSWTRPIKLKANTEYRLSGWIKTEGLKGNGRGALFNIHELQARGRTRGLKDKNDWTEVEVMFNTEGSTSLSLNCLFGGWGTATGTAWFDDVSIQEMVLEAGSDLVKVGPGDTSRGRAIFHEHPIASCIRCHQVGGEGGFVGPYMDGIAGRKEEAYIRESLLDPQLKIAEGYVSEISPMPPMGVLLTAQELEDVVAYLLTLKTQPKPGTIKKPEAISYE